MADKRRKATSPGDGGETPPRRRLRTRCSAPSSFPGPSVQAPTPEAHLPSNWS